MVPAFYYNAGNDRAHPGGMMGASIYQSITEDMAGMNSNLPHRTYWGHAGKSENQSAVEADGKWKPELARYIAYLLLKPGR